MLAATIGSAAPGMAQVRTIDPNQPIDSDLAGATQRTSRATPARAATPSQDTVPLDQAERFPEDGRSSNGTAQNQGQYQAQNQGPTAVDQAAPAPNVTGAPLQARSDTYQKDDLLAGGERAFGKGAAGMGGLLERILKDQGEPNAYIVGREGSGAIGVGLRYGSGTLSHKVEGDQPIYWTGPSLGFDFGGDAAKVFVLVYNLYDTADVFKRFPGAEGRLYFVGGFAATYQRRGNIVLIPVRLGVGYRAGVNVGYTKYSRTSKLLPF
jgi:hypothetical protein